MPGSIKSLVQFVRDFIGHIKMEYRHRRLLMDDLLKERN